jgi:hypothetical protein
MGSFFIFVPAVIALLCQLMATVTKVLWPLTKSIQLKTEFVDYLMIAESIAVWLTLVPITFCLIMLFQNNTRRLAFKALIINALAILCAFSAELFPGLINYLNSLPGEKAYRSDLARSCFEDYTWCKSSSNFTSMDMSTAIGGEDRWILCNYLDTDETLHWLNTNGWKQRTLQQGYDFYILTSLTGGRRMKQILFPLRKIQESTGFFLRYCTLRKKLYTFI